MKNERWLDLQRHDRDRRRHEENGAREASCYLTFTVKGAGEIIVNAAEEFHTPFLGEPSVAFGFELAVPPDLESYHLPRVTGGVFRWAVEGKDRHVGMFPYFTVDVDLRTGVDPTAAPSLDRVEVIAHMTFTGLSYKAMGRTVPARLADAAIPARPVPFAP